jgi:lipoprotein signal peptidase
MLELVACGTAWLLVDQWSKRVVTRRVRNPAAFPSRFLRPATNPKRISKGWMNGPALLVLWGMALVSAIVLIRWGVWFQSSAARFGLASAFGGAGGNLLDMLRRRAVLDFIDFRWWPCFNIADVAIVGGLALALWRS